MGKEFFPGEGEKTIFFSYFCTLIWKKTTTTASRS